MVVEFGRLRKRKVEKIGRAVLRGGGVAFLGFRGAKALLLSLMRGFRVGNREVTPADGRTYLEALPKRYRGDYLWAEKLEE